MKGVYRGRGYIGEGAYKWCEEVSVIDTFPLSR